jgi:hypothetical protein
MPIEQDNFCVKCPDRQDCRTLCAEAESYVNQDRQSRPSHYDKAILTHLESKIVMLSGGFWRESISR